MKNVAKKGLLLVLRGYKSAISPMLLPACRYVPTCSEYAMEAIQQQGPFRGSMKAIWRLLRCHPCAAGGYDPVVHHCHGPVPELATQSLRPTER